MKVLFIGGTKRGFQTLDALVASGAEVCGVLSLTQDEHEQERYEGSIRDLALGHGISLRETKFVRDQELARWARETGAATAIGVGVRILLPPSFYTAFPLGCWGVHDSLLPEYRGFAPLNWSIINDEPRTGVTVFRISERMDGGEILLQRGVSIGRTDTAPQVYERVCAATVEVVLEAYRQLTHGTAVPIPQDYSTGSFTCARTPVDGEIDWAQPSRRIYNLIRALTFPYPGAYTYYRGQRIFVLRAEEIDRPCYRGRIPGRVVQILPGQGVDVLTADGVLRVTHVSSDGRTTRSAEDVIRSVKMSLGLRLQDLEERLAEMERRLEALTTHATR